MRIIYIFLAICCSVSCTTSESKDNLTKWASEIIAVETSFNEMTQKEGLAKAFEYFAAEDGAIRRGKKVIKGKESIYKWYLKDVRPNETLTWKPTFVDVSSSGDLAYTYGNYIFTTIDSSDVKKENKGIFHTVWKRQENGEWKFVWD